MSTGAAHDVELAQPAWPLVRDLEEQMVSAPGPALMLQIRPGLSVLPGDLERGKEDDGSSVALPRSSRSEDIGSQADVLASITQKVKPYGAEHGARLGEEETENILEACWARGVEARTRAMQGAACGMARGQGGSPGGVGEPLGGLFGASRGLLVISWGPLGALRRFCVGLHGGFRPKRLPRGPQRPPISRAKPGLADDVCYF